MSDVAKIRNVLGSRITDLLEEEDILTDIVLFALSGVKEESFPEIKCSDVLLGPSFTNSDIDSLRTVQRRYIDIYCRESSGGAKSSGLSHGRKTPPKEVPRDPGFDVKVGSPGNVPPSVQDPGHYYELRRSGGKIGRALIIINREFDKCFVPNIRGGADKDKTHLVQLFKMLNIEYSIHDDLSALKMEEVIELFARDVSARKASVVFIAISSHGILNDIAGVDYTPEKPATISIIRIQELLIKNEHLRRIPKILVLQACRGTRIQESGVVSEKGKDEDKPANFAVISNDLLILYPTSLFFKAWRNVKDGSWMIEELMNCVAAYKDSLHFIEILTMCTYNILAGYETTRHGKQTCTFKSTLTKFLSFKD